MTAQTAGFPGYDLAAFWAEVLGYEVVAQDETGVVIAGSPTVPTLLFARSLEGKRDEIRTITMR